MSEILNKVIPVKRETLQGAVYEQLCQLILEGALEPGESVPVASIAKAFGVSPMPVREAISRLTSAGALKVVSGRSIGVPVLDQDTLADLRNVRLEVETLALEWAMRQVTPEFLARLESLLASMDACVAKDDIKGFLSGNYTFHFAIYKNAHSPVLLDIISNLWLRISPHFHMLRQHSHYSLSNEIHNKMLNAIRQGDVASARAALGDDIQTAYDIMLACLKALETEGGRFRFGRDG